MSYMAPYMDAAGLHLPTYNDILNTLIDEYKSIFGQDVYLENDSQDYQWISVIALKIHDTYQSIQLVYNNRSPSTAVGSGLKGLVKINGIKCKTVAHSTCDVTLTGTANAVIINGIIADSNGNNWTLPETVTIGSEDTVTVTATCEQAGDIAAGVGDLSTIVTPTKGWSSVTNLIAATEGAPIETDTELRKRQTLSVANPSQTLLEGTYGAIAAIDGVTRVRLYENDTNVADADGLVAHSIAAVVEGGVTADIAKALWLHKGVGGYTNGDISTVLTDNYGYETTIRFYRPTSTPIFVTINLKKLPGYVLTMADAIKTAIANYLNSLDIGEDLTISALWGVALATMTDITKPVFSITSVVAGTAVDNQSANDIIIAFNATTSGILANIIINAT